MKKGLVIALVCVGIVTVAVVGFDISPLKVMAAPKPGV
jgi:hypothetical protein